VRSFQIFLFEASIALGIQNVPAALF